MDEDLRALERAANEGDPEARAHLLRAQCRSQGHTWNHYKGGEHRCTRCGLRTPSDPRPWGAQTVFVTRFDVERELRRAHDGLEPEDPSPEEQQD